MALGGFIRTSAPRHPSFHRHPWSPVFKVTSSLHSSQSEMAQVFSLTLSSPTWESPSTTEQTFGCIYCAVGNPRACILLGYRKWHPLGWGSKNLHSSALWCRRTEVLSQPGVCEGAPRALNIFLLDKPVICVVATRCGGGQFQNMISMKKKSHKNTNLAINYVESGIQNLRYCKMFS